MTKKNDQTHQDILEFQICDWNSYHEIDELDEEKYVIQLFGRTEDDKDVCLKVIDFTPFFYVEIPSTWGKNQAEIFVTTLKKQVSWRTANNSNYDYDLSKSLVRHQLVQKKKFYNFTNNKLFKFIMLAFKSHTAMKEFSNVLARPMKVPGLTTEPMLYQRYESNIEPHIRFMHVKNLSSCGWVAVDKSKISEDKNYSNCDHSYHVDWSEVKPSDNFDNRIAPFKIMGYDIECISCDENFPQAQRKTDKIIQIGHTLYRYGSMNCYEQHILTLKACEPIEGAVVECYKTERGLIRGWAKKISELRPDFKGGYNNFAFDDEYIFARIARIDQEDATKQGIPVENLEPKFMDEILQIMGKVNNKYLVETEQINKTMRNSKNNSNGKYYADSLTYYEKKPLSSSALGDNELKFFQIPGIISVDVMKIIQRDHRLIGYKLDNVSANFITEGATKFIEGPEINDKKFTDPDSDKFIDADSGKFTDTNPDPVSGKTTDQDNGKIRIDIYTRSTKALDEKSYIQIMVNDGYSSSPLSEGAKYRVLKIDTVTEKKFNPKEKKEETFTFQCIKTTISQHDVKELREILLNPLLKVYWTFAKDDMHHTLINKYFREGRQKRIRQIAKYCLKDCKLVNLLLAKLEIIVNSIGMAKVCHVPLSYLFLRGQGVKIFSLVSKKCREKNFLIPVLRRKKKDIDGDTDETYEGATVITPKPGVYLSPIGVLDYSSLYPNSMREKNLSHECYINASKYNDLPGFIYHDVYITLKDSKGKIIRNIDGTPKKDHHRFAQELITDEQINDELRDIFGKINSEMEKNISKHRDQKYYSNDTRKEKISIEKTLLDKKIKEISTNKDLSEDSKDKLISDAKSKFNSLPLVILDERIKTELERLDVDIKRIESQTMLAEKSRQQMVADALANSNSMIDKLQSEVEVSDADREEFIYSERERAKRKIADEKAKRYNVVNGKTVRYGILPEILTELLNKRKETNGRLAQEKDPSMKSILNALQLAFKVTANSLYGQTGAPTSPIFFVAIAASTTAIGRERLHYAKKMVEENFPGAEVIYGDTDSIFINFHLKDADGNELTDIGALVRTIELCQQAAKLINDNVPKPQSIVYEKTLQPFILVAKKKYVGLLFEKDPLKCELKSMGIVLKRRDNAPIVKIVVGGIIDHILKHRDIGLAVEYTDQVIRKLIDGKYPISKFIISKTLRAKYKQKVNPKTGKKTSLPAHKILADRMAFRDPGNKPQANDRIPFVYIVTDAGIKKKKDILQGDLIEHPEYVIKNKLKIDYLYYLEHQIINPATQILELMMPTKSVEKLFNKFIIEEENRRIGRQSMEKWMDYSRFKSKTAKVPTVSLKNNNVATKPKYPNLPFVGKTKRHECQNMNKWLSNTEKHINSEDWEPKLDDE